MHFALALRAALPNAVSVMATLYGVAQWIMYGSGHTQLCNIDEPVNHFRANNMVWWTLLVLHFASLMVVCVEYAASLTHTGNVTDEQVEEVISNALLRLHALRNIQTIEPESPPMTPLSPMPIHGEMQQDSTITEEATVPVPFITWPSATVQSDTLQCELRLMMDDSTVEFLSTLSASIRKHPAFSSHVGEYVYLSLPFAASTRFVDKLCNTFGAVQGELTAHVVSMGNGLQVGVTIRDTSHLDQIDAFIAQKLFIKGMVM